MSLRGTSKWVNRFEEESDDDKAMKPRGSSMNKSRDRYDERGRQQQQQSSDDSDADDRYQRKKSSYEADKPKGGRSDSYAMQDEEEQTNFRVVRTQSRQRMPNNSNANGPTRSFVPKQPTDRPPKGRPSFTEEPDLSHRLQGHSLAEKGQSMQNSGSQEWAKAGRSSRDLDQDEPPPRVSHSNTSGTWAKSGGWVDSGPKGGQDDRDRDRQRGSQEGRVRDSKENRLKDSREGREGSPHVGPAKKQPEVLRDSRDRDRRPIGNARHADRHADRDRDSRDRDRDPRAAMAVDEEGPDEASSSSIHENSSDNQRNMSRPDRRGSEDGPQIGVSSSNAKRRGSNNSNNGNGKSSRSGSLADGVRFEPEGGEGAFQRVWHGPTEQQLQLEEEEEETAAMASAAAPQKVSFVLVAHPRGMRNQHIQCSVLRDRTSMQGKLYPQYELVLEEPRRTLIIARKMSLNRTSNYHLFDMTRGQAGTKLSKKAGNYLGKLRAKTSTRIEYSLLNHKEDKEEIAGISFDKVSLMDQLKEGTQPRKMKVLLPAPCAATGVVEGVSASIYGCDCLTDLLGELAEQRRSLSEKLLLVETKEPVLENGNYRLNFYGRVNLPSVKNFQMVHSSNIENILCQFGKVDEDVFHLDFKAPFNAVQAFALALCQFNL